MVAFLLLPPISRGLDIGPKRAICHWDFLAASLGSRVNFTLLLSGGFNTTYSPPDFEEMERKKEWKAWILIRIISRGEEPLWNFKFLKTRWHVKRDVWVFHKGSWGDLQYFILTSTATKLVARYKCYIVTLYYYKHNKIVLQVMLRISRWLAKT